MGLRRPEPDRAPPPVGPLPRAAPPAGQGSHLEYAIPSLQTPTDRILALGRYAFFGAAKFLALLSHPIEPGYDAIADVWCS